MRFRPCCESLARILINRLQHPKPGLPRWPVHAGEQATLHKCLHPIDDGKRKAWLNCTDNCRIFERPSARKHGEPCEQPLLIRREQGVAPRDRTAQRLLPQRHIAWAMGKHIKLTDELRQQRRRRKQNQPRSCELDRQGKSIQPATGFRYYRCVLLRQDKVVLTTLSNSWCRATNPLLNQVS